MFATFNLPNNEIATFETTGLTADRIKIFPSGGGLAGDGVQDAFYLLTYGSSDSAIPEPSTLGLAAAALGGLAWVRRRA